jgi:hypothetical protein
MQPLEMLGWHDIRKKSAIARKGWDFARQVPRAIVRRSVQPKDYQARPPLIGNSFPKSGTHQLLQVLEAFPGAVHYGSFVASMPSITFRERSEEAHLRRIRSLVPGEYLGAHIFFNERYVPALREMNAAHFFIYRDLRDVVVSEVHYLRDMNRWHRMHDYFLNHLKTDDERLMTAIEGVRDPGFAYDYPDIGARMRRYMPWIGRDDVFALRYEDLNSDRRAGVIRDMVAFFARHVDHAIDEDKVTSSALQSLDPQRSHTFREGGSGRWRDVLSAKHLEAFERVAGDINKALGYAA